MRIFLNIPVCKALDTGVAGLFGPQSSVTSSHIQSICDTLEVPHIETRWDYRLDREEYSLNLYPHPQTVGQVRQFVYLFKVHKSQYHDLTI